MGYPESSSYPDQVPITLNNGNQVTPLAVAARITGDGTTLAIDGETIRLALNGWRQEHPNNTPLELHIPLLGGAVMSQAVADSRRFTFFRGRMMIDPDEYQAYFDGNAIETPHKEFGLLNELGRNAGRVLTREYLLETVWGSTLYHDSRTLDVHIKRIRDKTDPDAIITKRGIGFLAAA